MIRLDVTPEHVIDLAVLFGAVVGIVAAFGALVAWSFNGGDDFLAIALTGAIPALYAWVRFDVSEDCEDD